MEREGISIMRLLRNKSFGKILAFYTVLFALLTMLVTLFFLFFIKSSFSQNFTNCYFDIQGLSISEGIVVISPGDFQDHLVSGAELGALFLRNMWGVFALFAVIQVILIGLLCMGVWNAHQKTVKEPLDELVSYLEKWEQSEETGFLVSGNFQRLKLAFADFERRVNQVYADFRHLGAYVSHEYKNAMALLRAKLQNGNTEKLLLMIDSLVKDMDDILTLCTHRGEDSPQKLNLALVCGKAVDEFCRVHSSINFLFDEEKDISVWGNEIWIYRAVCNLLDNAIKYGGGKEVDVVVGICHECPFLEVRDYGEGIESEEREKIFADGYRVATMKKDGYGIGLSLVKHVAWLSDAYLWVKSDRGKGTCLKMVFPSGADEKTVAS